MKYISLLAVLTAVSCSAIVAQNKPQGFRDLQVDAGKIIGGFILSRA